MIVDPTTAFCPNPDCPARGQSGKGNIRVHSRKEQRFICRQCGKTFAERRGTPFYRLRTSAETVTLVLTLLAHGCPIQAIVAAFGLDERTVGDWLSRAGSHCQAVHEQLVEQPRQLGQVQADELRVKIQGNIVWMAMAVMVGTRLWLGGEVSPSRDLPLIRRLMARVRRSALSGRILVCTDGLCSYVRATREAFRDKVETGTRGNPPLKVWSRLLIAQVVKRYERRRVTEVDRRVVHGKPEQVEKAREAVSGEGVINTAYIERLNGTFRERLAPLARRTRALARTTRMLSAGMWLVGTVYNFCTAHESLRELSGRAVRDRTPAMAAGITRRVWSVRDLLSYHVPPPRWTPPKKRGRRSKEMLALIEQWCQ
jgi:transposase-like protein/IS1 family transposase